MENLGPAFAPAAVIGAGAERGPQEPPLCHGQAAGVPGRALCGILAAYACPHTRSDPWFPKEHLRRAVLLKIPIARLN